MGKEENGRLRHVIDGEAADEYVEEEEIWVLNREEEGSSVGHEVELREFVRKFGECREVVS